MIQSFSLSEESDIRAPRRNGNTFSYLSCSFIYRDLNYRADSKQNMFFVCVRWLWLQTTAQTVMKSCVSVPVRWCCCCIRRMLTGVTSDFRTERKDIFPQPASLRCSCIWTHTMLKWYTTWPKAHMCCVFHFKTMCVPFVKKYTVAHF